MSNNRSGYAEDGDDWAFIRWCGAVKSALNGKRGQEFLVETARVLDALPAQRLAADVFEENGEYCLLGAVAASRGIDISNLDFSDHEELAAEFGISAAMVKEIMYQNDNCVWAYPKVEGESEKRWLFMRGWVNKHTKLEVKL